MHILAFILAIVAVVVFTVDYFLSRPSRGNPGHLVSLGLAVLTVAWIVQSIMVDGSRITVGG